MGAEGGAAWGVRTQGLREPPLLGLQPALGRRVCTGAGGGAALPGQERREGLRLRVGVSAGGGVWDGPGHCTVASGADVHIQGVHQA